MKYQNKILAIQGLFCFLVCLIFGLAMNARTASALSYAEISGQQVLGASTSTTYPYPSGSLVKDGSAIYFISGTTKIPFTNYKAFVGLGYSLRNVVAGDLSNYTSSQTYVINTAYAAHPWGSWLSYKGAVYYSTQQGIIGVPSAEVFLSNGGKWNMVVKANKYDIALIIPDQMLSVLTDNDPRVVGYSNLQFGGSNSSSQGIQTPSPIPTTTPTPTPSVVSVFATTTSLTIPQTVYASTTATFLGSSNDPNSPLVYTFAWDDGTQSNSLSVGAAVHTYYLPGTYMLQLSVTDNQNFVYTTTSPVTVVLPVSQTPTTPQLSLPSGIIVGQQATVSASASDPQGQVLSYIFDWGDGSATTVGNPNSATHIYSSSNSYVVKVTVTNPLGYTSTASQSIYIAP